VLRTVDRQASLPINVKRVLNKDERSEDNIVVKALDGRELSQNERKMEIYIKDFYRYSW